MADEDGSVSFLLQNVTSEGFEKALGRAGFLGALSVLLGGLAPPCPDAYYKAAVCGGARALCNFLLSCFSTTTGGNGYISVGE